jgi:hypothetical protein
MRKKCKLLPAEQARKYFAQTFDKGRQHDFKLFKNSRIYLKNIQMYG